MPSQPVTILDRERRAVATAEVEVSGRHYLGSVDLSRTPEPLRQLFEEFEECANGQLFSHLDEVGDRIAAAGMSISFPDGREIRADDLQIYPRAGGISFAADGAA